METEGLLHCIYKSLLNPVHTLFI